MDKMVVIDNVIKVLAAYGIVFLGCWKAAELFVAVIRRWVEGPKAGRETK